MCVYATTGFTTPCGAALGHFVKQLLAIRWQERRPCRSLLAGFTIINLVVIMIQDMQPVDNASTSSPGIDLYNTGRPREVLPRGDIHGVH
jgi:hypothetical protein